MKLISVVIPIYNVEKYIKKCIMSICRQSFTNLEIILVDDGSTDMSSEICDQFAKEDSRIRVFHQENGGRSAARNRGLKEAQGDYLMFVDGDDWLDEDCLYKTYVAIEKYQVEMVIFRGRNIYSDHTEDNSTGEECLFEGEEPLRFYIEGREGFQNLTAVWGKLYVRALVNNIRFVENKYYEDVMFMTKVYAGCRRCVYLDQAYYNYNIDTDGSITALGVNELTFRDEIPILYEKESYLRELGKVDLAERYSFFIYQKLLQYYCDCMHAHQKEFARRIAKLVYRDRCHVRWHLDQPYSSKYYKWYFSLFLLNPLWGYWFEELVIRLRG